MAVRIIQIFLFRKHCLQNHAMDKIACQCEMCAKDCAAKSCGSVNGVSEVRRPTMEPFSRLLPL